MECKDELSRGCKDELSWVVWMNYSEDVRMNYPEGVRMNYPGGWMNQLDEEEWSKDMDDGTNVRFFSFNETMVKEECEW